VENLTIDYVTEDETVFAVKNVDIKLRHGQVLGLLGETGAGKTSTVLSLLNLVPDPPGVIQSGTIKINGIDMLSLVPEQLEKVRGKEISMIFQDPMTSLNPVFTVGDQIAESIIIHEQVDKKEAWIRTCQMLETVGIPAERATEYPHQFSGGMKQRVIIAIALACHPKVLIADEPTTALDVTIQAQVLDLIRNLREQYQTATILVTHDLGIVAETCDEVAVMYGGRIVEYGTLREIFKETKHPYTEGLFNSLPKLGGDRSGRLKPIKGLTPNPAKIYPGCTFAERCPYATEACFQGGPPEAVSFGETHYVACRRYNEPDFHIARRK
jgi:peptide/nickel transport system ATP-binding protein